MEKIFKNASGVEGGGKASAEIKSDYLEGLTGEKNVKTPATHTGATATGTCTLGRSSQEARSVRCASLAALPCPGTGRCLLNLRSTFRGCSVSPDYTLLRFTAHIPARSS